MVCFPQSFWHNTEQILIYILKHSNISMKCIQTWAFVFKMQVKQECSIWVRNVGEDLSESALTHQSPAGLPSSNLFSLSLWVSQKVLWHFPFHSWRSELPIKWDKINGLTNSLPKDCSSEKVMLKTPKSGCSNCCLPRAVASDTCIWHAHSLENFS